jgi:hypothetical protein
MTPRCNGKPNGQPRRQINDRYPHKSVGWSGKQDRLALLLAQGETIRHAAGQVGIGEKTAYTWLTDRRFQLHISELRGRMLDAALGRLAEAATKAVDTLVDLLDTGKDAVRVRAALGILNALTQIRPLVEFEQRLAALETIDASQADHETRAT